MVTLTHENLILLIKPEKNRCQIYTFKEVIKIEECGVGGQKKEIPSAKSIFQWVYNFSSHVYILEKIWVYNIFFQVSHLWCHLCSKILPGITPHDFSYGRSANPK